MRIPTILVDDEEIPLTSAPTACLQSFVGGNFDQVETGPSDNPIVTQAIAARLIQERAQ